MQKMQAPCRKARFIGQRSAYLFYVECYFFLDAILCVVIFGPWQRIGRAYVGVSIMEDIVEFLGGLFVGTMFAGLFWAACVVLGG